MEIVISNSSDRPIYEQIAAQIKEQIMTGALAPAEQLPSIRALASSLRVSAITTKRAYSELESQGFIETVQGKGCFVTGGNQELMREERLREIESWMLRSVDGGRAMGLSDPELIEMFSNLLGSDE
ncbi:MAG: GntR family transcriptional regulator [Collinsella sp.]|nr:GntR family transcriptional regulator [Collinsella sp.]